MVRISAPLLISDWISISVSGLPGYPVSDGKSGCVSSIWIWSQFGNVCPKSSDPFYIITYYIKWVTTSWTYSNAVSHKPDVPIALLQIWKMQLITMNYENSIQDMSSSSGVDTRCVHGPDGTPLSGQGSHNTPVIIGKTTLKSGIICIYGGRTRFGPLRCFRDPLSTEIRPFLKKNVQVHCW